MALLLVLRILPALLGVSLAVTLAAETPAWTGETVDSSGVGMYSSLKVDKDGNVHVAYVVEPFHILKYAFWDHALKRWFPMTVAPGASFCSLALDSKQHPHISYTDVGFASGAQLHHAYWDSAAWKIQAVPLSSDAIAYYTSIVLDANDNPSIAFYEYRGPKGTTIAERLRLVAWDGKSWRVRTLDDQNQSGKFNAMAIDSHGGLHVAYANVNPLTASMRYTMWDGATSKIEVLDGREPKDQKLVGLSTVIALDKDDNPHIAYMNYSSPGLKYAVRKNGRWEVQNIDRLADVGSPDRNSIAIDDQQRPYLGYYDSGRGILKVAHRDGQKWLTETVDSNFAGFTSSMDIKDGTIWISYGDEVNSGLKVARRQIAIESGDGGGGHVSSSLVGVKP
jgi:hypothetical protein